jgi:integrase/recombinase XerD
MSKQSKTKQKNEGVKRRYLHWMKEAKGFSDKSIDSIEKALWKYEEFTKQEDYCLFSSKRANQFKQFLKINVNKRSKITLGVTSQYHYLRHVKRFFTWLSGQPGYKSRVSADDALYLDLSQKQRRQATTTKSQRYPTLEQVKALCSFEVKTEIDQRDRALIAFTALTGMRDRAIVTLPIGCFNPISLCVDQDPKKGVETKFSKSISTTLFRINEDLINFVVDWYNYLVKNKKYSITDPLFPSTEIGHISNNHHAYEVKGVNKSFWADTGAMRKIFNARSNQVDMPYFSPHKFRHFIIDEVKKHISSMEQLKAVSQNLGHENITTTFGYGIIEETRVSELVGDIDFSGLPKSKKDNAQTEKMLEIILKKLDKK